MANRGKYEKPVRRKKKRRVLPILPLFLMLLLLLGVVLMAIRLIGGTPSKNAQEPELQVDSEAVEWTVPELADQSGGGKGIQIPGYGSITIPGGSDSVNLVLLNPEGNPCYFTFSLVLTDTGESLYQSSLVPPGQAVSQVTLSRVLDPGEYGLTISIATTSLADGSAMNGANVETVLIVQ